MARASRSAPRRRCSGALLVRRPDDLGGRRLYPSALADVARFRHHRRRRPRPWLHLARLNPDQMVPRPTGHGHRHGHHGFRWRRHDRLAARHYPHELLRHPDLGRRVGDLRDHGDHLFRLHDVRCVRLPAAADRVEAARLDAPGEFPRDDHHGARPPQSGPQDSAVLADLARALSQRLRRYRHHRRGLPDASGDLRRPPVRRSHRRLRAIQ